MTKWFIKSTVFSIATVLFFVACNPPKGGKERVGAAPNTVAQVKTEAEVAAQPSSEEIKELVEQLKAAKFSEDEEQLEAKAKELLGEKEFNKQVKKALLQSHIVFKEVFTKSMDVLTKEEVQIGNEKYKASIDSKTVFLAALDLVRTRINESDINRTVFVEKACDTKEPVQVLISTTEESMTVKVKDCSKTTGGTTSEALVVSKSKEGAEKLTMKFNPNVFRKAIGTLGVFAKSTRSASESSINCIVENSKENLAKLNCDKDSMVKDILLNNVKAGSTDVKAILAQFKGLSIDLNSRIEAQIEFIESLNVAALEAEPTLLLSLNRKMSAGFNEASIKLQLVERTSGENQIAKDEIEAAMQLATKPALVPEVCDVADAGKKSTCQDIQTAQSLEAPENLEAAPEDSENEARLAEGTPAAETAAPAATPAAGATAPAATPAVEAATPAAGATDADGNDLTGSEVIIPRDLVTPEDLVNI